MPASVRAESGLPPAAYRVEKKKINLFLKLKAFLACIYHVSLCWQKWCKWHIKAKLAIYGTAHDPNIRRHNSGRALLGQQN